MLQCPYDIQTLFLLTTPKTYLFADKGVESVQLLLEQCAFSLKYIFFNLLEKSKIHTNYTCCMAKVSF